MIKFYGVLCDPDVFGEHFTHRQRNLRVID